MGKCDRDGGIYTINKKKFLKNIQGGSFSFLRITQIPTALNLICTYRYEFDLFL